jgi:hypothetical protein
MKKELSEELLETYYPYSYKLTGVLVKLKIPAKDIVEARSILNRAYMNALEVGFEEGVNWEKLKANKK